MTDIAIIGAPTSAGAHWPGQEKAPAALRAAGLVERIAERGIPFTDMGDLPVERWRPDRTEVDGGTVNNLAVVAGVARAVAGEVERAIREDRFPVVIGGDCTITVGAFAGMLRAGTDPALIYVDGGWDLSTPADYPAGILDSMGSAHLLGLPGTVDELAGLGPRRPMLATERWVPFGQGPRTPNGTEERRFDRLGVDSITASDATGRGAAAAAEALTALPADIETYLVHFDVDVMDFFGFPVADVPVFTGALPRADAVAAVATFVADPRCAGLTLTEFNPDHASPDGREARQFGIDIAGILSGRVDRR